MLDQDVVNGINITPDLRHHKALELSWWALHQWFEPKDLFTSAVKWHALLVASKMTPPKDPGTKMSPSCMNCCGLDATFWTESVFATLDSKQKQHMPWYLI